MLANILERLDHWFIHQSWGSFEGLEKEKEKQEEEIRQQANPGIVFVLDCQGIFRQSLGITSPRLARTAEYFLGKQLRDLDLSDCTQDVDQAISEVFLHNRVMVLSCQVLLGQKTKEYEVRIFPGSLGTATAVVTEMNAPKHSAMSHAGSSAHPASAKLWKA